MKDLLINCYFDGMTLTQAVDFIQSCYGKAPSEKQINQAQESIKSFHNKEWN